MSRCLFAPLVPLLLLFSAPACGGGGDRNAPPDSGGHSDGGPSDGGGDATPPVPGTSLTASNPTSSTVDLSWTAASDNVTGAADLEYRVYFALTSIDTEGDAQNHGTAAGDWGAALTSLTVEGLSLDTTYFFNVLVRDEAGNVSTYGGVSETTLGGSWRDVEPLEAFTDGSTYYSALAISRTGDVAHYWSQEPTWETHFAIRDGVTGALGAAGAWSAADIHTEELFYGFDGRLAGASIRRNSDASADVFLATSSALGAITFDTVASGLAADYVRTARACVAENGNAMVVWIDGTSDSEHTVRVRFRTGSAWGTAGQVNAVDGHDLSGLEVVCSPDGDHLVLYGEDDSDIRVLSVRVYDQSAGDWASVATPLGEHTYQSRVAAARAADGRVVVAWEEYDETEMVSYLRARTYAGGTWSSPAETLADDDPVSVSSISLAAAGDDVHAVWRGDDQLVTRRLPGGSSSWTAETPLETVAGLQEFCVAGDPYGGALLVWVSGDTVQAQPFSRSTSTWGTVTPIHEGGDSVGHGSLACGLDAQRRASVVYTEWDPIAETYSAFVRTYR